MSVTKTSLTHQKVKYFFSYSSYLGKSFFLYSWLVQLLKTNEYHQSYNFYFYTFSAL